MAELLSSIQRDKMTHAQKERFQNSCLKVGGVPSNPTALNKLSCEIGDDELEIKEDFSRATVNSSSPETKASNVRGTVEEFDNIHMEMIGDPEKDDTVTKSIVVEGENGQVSLTNHDSVPTT